MWRLIDNKYINLKIFIFILYFKFFLIMILFNYELFLCYFLHHQIITTLFIRRNYCCGPLSPIMSFLSFLSFHFIFVLEPALLLRD